MNEKAPRAPTVTEIRTAADSLAPFIAKSPLLSYLPDGRSGGIFLKLENLQAIGAFKARPAGSILLGTDAGKMRNGVYTASSGNAGLGLAWMANELQLAATVYAPDNAPADKLAAIKRLGPALRILSPAEWWDIILHSGHSADPGMYVDAVRDPLALAGNGTIGLEIAEQCPEVDTVLLPFGGGGLTCGVASALRVLKPGTRIVVAECETAAPLSAALQAGRPVEVETQQSFISGAGAPTILREMWPLVSDLVDDTIVVPEKAVASAVRQLFLRSKVVAEGAGALALAAALSAGDKFGTTVCVVSGGNIDASIMAAILREPAD